MADNLPTTLRFTQLCELAAKEADPKKMLELTREINRIFDERKKAKQPTSR